jgi:DNA repair exonuclease SbcCD ATPase subunit
MIKLESITLKEFRGIRDLTLNLANDNFVICGPNGTGKSGIVDAIEFALTGSISRLLGAGTGGITVKDHGPHVDSRNNPEKASVTLKVFIPSKNKSATIHRTVKNANKPTITPADADIKLVLEYVALHPEFVLSRRELIRYVLSEPGKRSQEVQALLRLDDIENLRKVLHKIANAEAKLIPIHTATKKNSGDDLMRAMVIAKLSSADVLAAANEKRSILSLPPLSSFEADTSLKDGLAGITSLGIQSPVPKASTLADIKAVKEQSEAITNTSFKTLCDNATSSIEDLQKKSVDGKGAAREALLQSALNLFDEEFCPVCDSEWEPDKFRQLINQKLRELLEVTKARNEVVSKLDNLIQPLEKLCSALTTLIRPASLLTPQIDTTAIRTFIQDSRQHVAKLKNLFPLEETTAAIIKLQNIPPDLSKVVNQIARAVEAIPEPTQQDAARDYLVIAQERVETHRNASQQLKKAEERSRLATDVYNTYIEATTVELDKIYKDVEQSFIEMYREINADEDKFKAQLTPSAGKLGFDVDFYGRGFFPPGAYHSEGHQDGMGLCLYLALMNHLLKDNFKFAVLDDVLMSVDSGHRREVTKMLKTRFPNVQFIMTTHDEIWLRTMKTIGLIVGRKFVHFRKWTVDLGPTEWDDRDVWKELDDYLSKNDVRAAAGLLRHYLEYISQEACQALRAHVEFRGDAQFELGGLLPNAILTFSKTLKKGKASAQSWSNKTDESNLTAMEDAFNKSKVASNVEQWQINPAVHYNQWANFHKNDFEPVVKAFNDLLGHLSCPNCHELLYIVPEKGDQQSLRCGCANINVNLITKPKP